MLSRQEDLRYGVSKLGNKVTKGQKNNMISRKSKSNEKEVLLC